jgi:hypothetical protein
LNRQGSVAVMETVTPSRVGVGTGVAASNLGAGRRNRSGSASGYRSEGDVTGGLKVPPVALKDVLKVRFAFLGVYRMCMADGFCV